MEPDEAGSAGAVTPLGGPMYRYRRMWLSVWGTVTGLGVVLALMEAPIGRTLLLFVIAAVLAVLTTYIADPREGRAAREPRGRLAWTRGARTGCAAVAIAGLGAAIHPLLLVLLALAVATSPKAVYFYRRHAQPGTPAQAPGHGNLRTTAVPADAATFAPSIHGLKDADLCHAWCASYALLQQARSPALRGYIVALRQAYLDECDARNPAGLAAWLDSGARAAGNPETFLTGGCNPNTG
ncbi:MAG: hypothetical protein ACHP7K_11660 [Actinomycetales bacterium]